MTWSGGVSPWKEACSNRVMHWIQLYGLLSQATLWAIFLVLFLLLDLFVFKKKKKTKQVKKKSIWEPKRWERFNPQNVRTQTRRQGSGQRSNGPELSPFRLRTSEVPLCAALHLFYPSSLIRPGRPGDPGARVTCQMTVYSWAQGLDARSTFVLPGRREEGGSLLQCDTKKKYSKHEKINTLNEFGMK